MTYLSLIDTIVTENWILLKRGYIDEFIDKALSEITNGEDLFKQWQIFMNMQKSEKSSEIAILDSKYYNSHWLWHRISHEWFRLKSYKNVIEALTDMGLIEEAKY